MIEGKNFQLDSFQKKAIDAVRNNESVLVSAPTGSGKTLIAEYVIQKCLKENAGVIYTAPIKALSNQKFREFQAQFPNDVGIITGDVNIRPEAPLIIMTTEIFRNRILENPRGLEGYAWIIFDEIHYLDDTERGTVWEESLIFLPPHMRIVGLSATIPNIQQFAQWTRQTQHNNVKVIVEDKRPVPLHFFFQCRGKILDDLNVIRKIGYAKQSRPYRGGKYQHHGHSSQKNPPNSLIRHLQKAQRLPCIYFAFSRRRCEYLAERAIQFEFLNHEERERIISLFDHLCQIYQISGDARTQQIRDLLEQGIAYHHAGIHPMLKEVIEQLFTLKLIKIIFTTETFALGVNMPAKTVVVDDLVKKYGRFHRPLRVRDFFQMAGRGGRRGIDPEGYVYSRINPAEISFQQLRTIMQMKTEPIKSKFNASYASILSLYETHGENLMEIYTKSFHYFQEQDKDHSSQLRAMHARLKILKSLGYIENQKLTPKGIFAKNIHGYELPMSELHQSGFLETLSPRELAILCLAAVFEPRPNFKKRGHIGRAVKRIRNVTTQTIQRIHRIEKQYDVHPLSKKFFYDLSEPLFFWLKEIPFQNLMDKVDMDEGEIIRYFRMSIQILREILHSPVSKELKNKIKDALAAINRGVIDAEEQLKTLASDYSHLE